MPRSPQVEADVLTHRRARRPIRDSLVIEGEFLALADRFR